MDPAERRKFLRELPLAIALLIASTAYLVSATAPYADRLASEHVHSVIAMVE